MHETFNQNCEVHGHLVRTSSSRVESLWRKSENVFLMKPSTLNVKFMPSRSGVKNPWVGTIWPHSKKVSFLYLFCTFNYGA